MKRWYAVAMIGVTLVGVTLLRGQVPGAGAVAVPGAVAGRYQLIPVPVFNSNDDVWMIDTQTGDTWRRQSQTGRWTCMGNPTQDPGTRLPPPAARGRAASQPAPVLPEVPRP